MQAWQATVQDDRGNAVPNPIVTVYEEDGVSEASIFNEAGDALPNPLTGTLDGFVQFFAEPGRYKIEGSSAGATTEVWDVSIFAAYEDVVLQAAIAEDAAERAEDAVSQLVPISSYAGALAVATSASSNVLAVAAVIGGREVRWVRAVGGACLGGGWNPSGTPEPAHFNGSLQDLVNYGGKVLIPRGQYTSSSISIPNSALDLVMESGAVIQFTGSDGFIGGGSVGGNWVLSGNAAKGATVIPVMASGATVGDWVRIRSSASRTSNQPRNGEIAKVLAVDATTVTVDRPIADQYTTADGARIDRLNMASGISITGGTIIGQGSAQDLGVGIEIFFAEDVKISGVTVRNFYNRGVSLNSCVNFNIHGNTVTGALRSDTGYGVLCAAACQWGNVSKNYVEDCGKVWDQGGLSSEFGLTRWVHIKDNHGVNLTRGGISTHETCEFIYISGNTIQDIPDSVGMLIRSVNTEVKDNTIINPGLQGIMCSNRGQSGSITVSGNDVTGLGVNADGIYILSQPNTPGTLNLFFTMVNVCNNKVVGGRNCIVVEAFTGNLRGVVLSSNNVQSFSGDGLLLKASGSSILGASVTGNYIYGSSARSGIRLRADTGIVNEVIISGNGTVGVGTGILADGPSSVTSRTQVTGNVLRVTLTGITGITSETGNMIVVG